MKHLFLIIMMMIGISNSVQAEESYLGIGPSMYSINYSDPGVNINQSNPGFMLKYGSDFNEYMGFEFRLGMSLKGETTVGASKVEFDTFFYSILLKPQYPLTQELKVYALAGMTSFTLNRKQTTTAGTVLLNDKASKLSASYGAGTEFKFKENMSISADWIQYWSSINIGPQINTSAWATNLTYNYYF